MVCSKDLIEVATGRRKADLVLKNGNIINVFTGEIQTADVAIVGDTIAGIGNYSGTDEVDCTDKYICPGFIDGHLHIESSLVLPDQLARAIIKSGTTTMIADPHEIVNVLGTKAMDFFLSATENIPVTTYLMLPSSVPATSFETAGADFTPGEMAPYFSHPRVLGLGEVMCYPNVVAGENTICEKLDMGKDFYIDGHAPGLQGDGLQAYCAAGVRTDHECTTFDEALSKIRAGLSIMVREGSAAKNLSSLISGWISSGLSDDKFMFCTDDKHIDDIVRDGHIRWNVRLAINLGVDPITAIKMASYNTAVHFGLRDVGAVSAGYKADLVVLSNLKKVVVDSVYKSGINVDDILKKESHTDIPHYVLNTVKCEDITPSQISMKTHEKDHVIAMEPYQIATTHLYEKIPQQNGQFAPDSNYSKLCVIERHGKNGNIAVAPLKGYGIHGGAIATTVAHDSHNIIVAGDNDRDICIAANHLKSIGGGYVVVKDGSILGDLPLPVAGLMSDKSFVEVKRITSSLLRAARDMGVHPHVDPFVSLSFMALPVIPEIRLSDMGLFDVTKFELI